MGFESINSPSVALHFYNSQVPPLNLALTGWFSFLFHFLKVHGFELTLASVIKLLWDADQSCARAPRGHGSLQRSQVRFDDVMHVNTEKPFSECINLGCKF